MVIAIGGRKHSGKSLLVSELQKIGYQKIAFADKLKDIICDLYGFDLCYLNSNKEIILDNPLRWNDDIKRKFSEISEISFNDIPREEKTFNKIREALQYIGTDVCRKIKNDYHIEETFKRLIPIDDYCLEDVRFVDEKKAVDNDGFCIFVIRPNDFKISNHQSEIDLSWRDFKYTIVNDGSVYKLIEKLNLILSIENNNEELIIDNPKKINRDFLYDINEHNIQIVLLLYNIGIIKKCKFCNKYYLKVKSSFKKDILYISNLLNINCNKIKHKNDNYEIKIFDPYILENLKKLDFIPDKDMINHIPEIIINNNLTETWKKNCEIKKINTNE